MSMTAPALVLPATVATHPGWGAAAGGPGSWIVFPILWFLLFAAVVFLVARRARQRLRPPARHGRRRPGRALRASEIDETEYRHRLAVLRGEERR